MKTNASKIVRMTVPVNSKNSHRCILAVVLLASLFIIYLRSIWTTGYTFDKSDAGQHYQVYQSMEAPGAIPLTRDNSTENGTNLILLTSYQRCGSTFVGAVMGWHEDSFSWVEPLWGIYGAQYINPEGVVCQFRRPNCELRQDCLYYYTDQTLGCGAAASGSRYRHSGFNEELQVSFQAIKDIYNCTFFEADWVKTYVGKIPGASGFLNMFGPSWAQYRNCRDQIQSRCLQRLVPICMNSRYRVIKILRMDLRLSSQLLLIKPTLKQIHLFRDPRGQLNSHIHTSWYGLNENNTKEVEDDVKALCERMRKDLKTARRLVEEFPDRFRIVQYEDFDNLMDKSRKLYEFLGMEFDEKAKTLMTQLGPKSDKTGFHPFSYRDSLHWQSVKLVNEHCSDLCKELQYNIFQTEADLRNHSIPALSGPLPYSL